jgi:hypothetical protein
MDTTPGNSEFYKRSYERMLHRQRLKEEALKDPFHYLAADLTAKRKADLGVDFKKSLKEKKFKTAEHYSKGCINISVKATEIPEGSLNGYVSDAINAFNVPISHYLSEVKKTQVEKRQKHGLERSIYMHLKDSKIEDEKLLGSYFYDVYGLIRNERQHILISDEKGAIDVKEIGSDNKLKRDALKWLKGGINPLLRLYRRI